MFNRVYKYLPLFIPTAGGWSTEGCSLQGIVNDTIICECNHMTNFAALVVSNYVVWMNPRLKRLSRRLGCQLIGD